MVQATPAPALLTVLSWGQPGVFSARRQGNDAPDGRPCFTHSSRKRRLVAETTPPYIDNMIAIEPDLEMADGVPALRANALQ